MADKTDYTGLGLIVGMLAAVVVFILAFGVGPRFFDGSSGPADVNIRVETPARPAVPSG